MKRNILILTTLFLTACASSNVVSSSSPNNSSSIEEISSYSSKDTSSSIESSSSSKNSSSSKGNGMSIIIGGTSSNSNSKESSSIDPNILTDSQAEELIVKAYGHDKECTNVNVSSYDILLKYYTKKIYSCKRYTNNITYYSGEMTYTDFYSGDKTVSDFKQQIMYKNDEISNIIKYDSSFINKAYKTACNSQNAETYLSLGQAAYAYTYFTSIKKNKNLISDSKITENGYYISLMYYEEPDDNGYANAGAIELSMDKDYYINDFFYTEGVYDWMYMDDVATMRRHGPAPYGDGGVIYEITGFKYKQYEEYKDELVFPLEENFIKSVEFKNETISIEKSTGYIDLYDYIVTDPAGGETSGCPYNNLVFASSDSSVASVDSHYLDLNKTGTVSISVSDSATGAKPSKSLIITIK